MQRWSDEVLRIGRAERGAWSEDVRKRARQDPSSVTDGGVVY